MSAGEKDAGNAKLGPAPTRLRQIALAARDLDKARQLLTYVLGIGFAFEDDSVEQWGLKNFIGTLVIDATAVPLGGDFIEVVSPFKEHTTVGKLLDKRGDGGFMIIMQTEDAKKRREYITANKLASVIFDHEFSDSVCIQYHPKGIKGGLMPELDSHTPGPANPNPLGTRFSPWHACGPASESYMRGMEQTGHLALEGCVLRLEPGDVDAEGAARQWEEIFGVSRRRDLLAFTNARLVFMPGQDGLPEGLVSITVGVQAQDSYDAILERARTAGVWGEGCAEMCGTKWYFTLTGRGDDRGKL
ncbi:hypothetical protein COCC4DRAFT_76726 [Bipolaris maydis ATCC 48331]|uniref:Glyoxalase-like domain-containing protein n=2 Tax=Cochliobolus heterostrophus TaxID=5016 RepID=M2TPP1_COCH5|nr:uncharacterized protein COCC4DRAFT_76726 [Bipolaris maydis ATCC 48331]EMD88534.1 hypothetical protein COCHEDRAFT_1181595 [Bipolaris maydis C5]KAJ5026298.1 hypothetical protein J3E73DRAFT_233829 [Bipolaris maydis]ENH99173.1 hypothetical protein COCC4DRAFT_76726 [Bipolaris maydis ATCC 48331]KAJ5051380.1 hypothetical protein J3E74DRAFT_283097 [Bipolaris maydis]KAJ6196424.1 hypothetical protein J3E72DRAFT_246091 [Bipolaris maydis]